MLTLEQRGSLYTDCKNILSYYATKDRIDELDKNIIPKLLTKYQNDTYAKELINVTMKILVDRLAMSEMIFEDLLEFDKKFEKAPINEGLNFMEMKDFVRQHSLSYAENESADSKHLYIQNFRYRMAEAGAQEFN